jgi:hypothetical protein
MEVKKVFRRQRDSSFEKPCNLRMKPPVLYCCARA